MKDASDKPLPDDKSSVERNAEAPQSSPFAELEGASDLVVVVEDSKPSAAVTALLFRKLGFQVIECVNGEEAISKLNSLPETILQKIRLVFSDFMMPKKNGLELLEFIRAHKTLSEIHFVICSAVPDRENVTKARSLNVAGFIVKPISAEKARDLVARILPQHKIPKFP